MIKLLLTIGDVATNEFELTKTQVTIGRSADNDIVLDDPLVSGHHALVVAGDGSRALLLQDLNSTNGTRINGNDIRNSPLKHGDALQIGRSIFRVYDDEVRTPTVSQI
ncbi:MAG: FHA domain-containing protein [Gammaproteobacteria bacterium]|nr:FHA domain-containing protein [Gammaproteobacteria bacterium]